MPSFGRGRSPFHAPVRWLCVAQSFLSAVVRARVASFFYVPALVVRGAAVSFCRLSGVGMPRPFVAVRVRSSCFLLPPVGWWAFCRMAAAPPLPRGILVSSDCRQGKNGAASRMKKPSAESRRFFRMRIRISRIRRSPVRSRLRSVRSSSSRFGTALRERPVRAASSSCLRLRTCRHSPGCRRR